MKNTASRCRGYFYPRSPCGERRLSYFYIIKITQFLSTLSLRRATIPDREPAAGYLISIHALLAESDPTRWAPTCRISNFYPRSPCGERPSLLYSSSCIHRFLSTLSLRRATVLKIADKDGTTYDFYPRSPCGERPPNHNPCSRSRNFYPRSPCGERRMILTQRFCASIFLSTLSLRRATNSAYGALDGASISIHALLAESDNARPEIHPLCAISIHALLAESDA